MFVNCLIITLFTTYIIYSRGLNGIIKSLLNLKNEPELPKPFSCEVCLSFWFVLIYCIIEFIKNNCSFFDVLLYSAFFSYLSTFILKIFGFIRYWVDKFI